METEGEPTPESLQDDISDAIARHDCEHRPFEREGDIPGEGCASQRRATNAGDCGGIDVAGFLVGRFEEFLHALIVVHIRWGRRIDEE